MGTPMSPIFSDNSNPRIDENNIIPSLAKIDEPKEEEMKVVKTAQNKFITNFFKNGNSLNIVEDVPQKQEEEEKLNSFDPIVMKKITKGEVDPEKMKEHLNRRINMAVSRKRLERFG